MSLNGVIFVIGTNMGHSVNECYQLSINDGFEREIYDRWLLDNSDG